MYTITKTVGRSNYWIQEYRGKICWNGLFNNAKTFPEERLAKAYCLQHKINDGEVKPKITMTEEIDQEVAISPHKIRLVQMLADGHNTRTIAQALGNSYRTIEVHMHQLKKQLNCDTAAHIVATFFRAGLIK